MIGAMTRVAVVIPVLNGELTIARAIDSAIAQRFDGEAEVIVVDDGSTDATSQILERYRGRIRVVCQDNHGPAAARNAAATRSTAEYLAFLDADDAFMPNKLARTVAELEKNRTAVLLFHDAIAVDRAGRELAQSYVPAWAAHAPSLDEMLARWWPIVPTTAVMRRATFDTCGGFDEAFKSAGFEDPYLWIRAREHGEFIYLPEALAAYTLTAPAERSGKYLHSQDLFIRKITERYGSATAGLIRGTRRGYASALGYAGLLAMRDGDRAAARRYFLQGLRYQPADLKCALRLLKTFLPAPVARALSGRTVRTSASVGTPPAESVRR
ncbi:MAG TPA: glycosyltransferase [Candidatus Binataceae bacterium]|nr:glycosyltransferase [Candidatus Binataceae bacterium]